MANANLKNFADFLATLVADYAQAANRDCREAVKEGDNPEKIIAAREALARHETALEILDLVTTHRGAMRNFPRAANGRFAKKR